MFSLPEISRISQGSIETCSNIHVPQKTFAKLIVHKVFQDLQLNVKHPGLGIIDFENAINHAPPSLSQTDKRPLFEDEEGERSPKTLEERITELQETIQKMELRA